MTFRGSANSRSTVHPSMGSPANDTRPLCCARCRRGTPATGLGPCGYGDKGCPNVKCGCHIQAKSQNLEQIAAHSSSLALDGLFMGATNDQ